MTSVGVKQLRRMGPWPSDIDFFGQVDDLISCVQHIWAGMKFLLIDDHAVVRDGLAALLQSNWPGADIVHAASIEEAIASAGADFDLALMDLVLPDSVDMGGLERFCRSHPQCPVAVLSSSEAPDDARRALALGALGYIPKSAQTRTLIAAVKLVLSGEIYVPLLVLNALEKADLAPSAAAETGPLSGLTERQLDVLRLLSDDALNKQIAHRLDISEKTVKAHLTTIFRHLGVTRRAQAVRIFQSQCGA